jgi:hypothetical protein
MMLQLMWSCLRLRHDANQSQETGDRGQETVDSSFLLSAVSCLLSPVSRCLLTPVSCLLAAVAFAQPPLKPAEPQPATLVMENQFEQKADLADYRGAVVILVYGDRKGTDACRKLGEQLHVAWHPDAAGQTAYRAQTAPVAVLPGLQPGQPSPDVRVIPVACCGKVPGPIRGAIRTQIAKGSPDVPVWLDFTDTMKANFTLTVAEPNVVVFDAAGRLRMKINGTPDQAAVDRLTKAVQGLRYEAVK